ncbi:uncharacterized protein LOC124555993 [Schistocerca americana]|uniref:uncharacterized protein LOC124555993 n=1 Tax=Schistocerca americana TaxID=7009 RepID=UPI001F4FD365|nr:uncharacterized protein LOC124555993 [Schistocerca americana]
MNQLTKLNYIVYVTKMYKLTIIAKIDNYKKKKNLLTKVNCIVYLTNVNCIVYVNKKCELTKVNISKLYMGNNHNIKNDLVNREKLYCLSKMPNNKIIINELIIKCKFYSLCYIWTPKINYNNKLKMNYYTKMDNNNKINNEFVNKGNIELLFKLYMYSKNDNNKKIKNELVNKDRISKQKRILVNYKWKTKMNNNKL